MNGIAMKKIEMAGRQVAARIVRGGLLGAHHDRVDEAADQHDQRQHDVHDADALVIDAGQPVVPERPPPAEPCDHAHNRKSAKNRDQRAAHSDPAVER
jgi:hypothetical protein